MVRLRDRRKSDIEDYIKWFTEDVEWMNWDAPWEDDHMTSQEVIEHQEKYLQNLAKRDADAVRYSFEAEDEQGRHIGWLNAYDIDENLQYFPEPKKEMLAIGIDLPAIESRGKGYGTEAFRKVIAYYRSKGLKEIYTQTWSGNVRMVALALRCGFQEYVRIPGIRHVRGNIYDALTFRMEL